MLGDDIEKNRVEYVSRLEQDNLRIKRERDEFKALATQHEIKISFKQVLDANNNSILQAVCIYGSKVFTVNISAQQVFYYKDDKSGLLRHVINTAVSQLVVDSLIESNSAEFSKIHDNMVKLFQKGLIQ